MPEFDPFNDTIVVQNPQIVPTARQQFEQNTDSPSPGQRSPQNWYPKNFTIPAAANFSDATQISTPLIGKVLVTIINTGTNPIRVRPVQNQNVPFITINANAERTFTTEGEFWATSILGSTVEVVETYFMLASGMKGGELEWPSIDNALHRDEISIPLLTDTQVGDLLNP